MHLFIAEKPSVARAISEQLGVIEREKSYITCTDNNIVTWCFGHLLELAMPDEYLPADIPLTKKGTKKWREQDLPILPDVWQIKPKPNALVQLNAIGELLKQLTGSNNNQTNQIINAGDPDREGQLLVDEIISYFSNQNKGLARIPVLRFWTSSMDETSISKALNNLKPNQDYEALGIAAKARSRADWLIGMNLTRSYTLSANKSNHVGLISVGRVQTPTLNLIAGRDNEIANFKPHDFYKIYADLEHVNGNFRVLHKPCKQQNGLDSEGRIIDKELADQIIREIQTDVINKIPQITSYKTTKKSLKQALPFSLADVTKEANSRYGFTADEVLGICQSLYETHKLTSYPRTDCRYLPLNMHAQMVDVLKAIRTNLNNLTNSNNVHNIPAQKLVNLINKADPQIKSHAFNDKKVTAHHGIIPTVHIGDLAQLNANEAKVYELIVKRYLAQSFAEYKYLETKVSISIADEKFSASGQTPQDLGWKIIYQAEENSEEDQQDSENLQTPNTDIPQMQKGDKLSLKDLAYQTGKTTAPSAFTEGSLIGAMENIHKFIKLKPAQDLLKDGDGIGTPATRANIITDLKKRGFIEVKGKKLVTTDLGKSFIKTLENELISSPILTAQFERTLKEIAQIGLDLNSAKDKLDQFMDTQIKFVTEQVQKISEKELNLAQKSNSSDPQKSKKDNKINDLSNNLTKNKAQNEKKVDSKTKKVNKNNDFPIKQDQNYANNPPTQDQEKPPVSELHKCTSCGSGLIRRPSKFKGFWWGCSSFPSCKTTYFDQNGKPNYESKKE